MLVLGLVGFLVWMLSIIYIGFSATILWSWFIVPFGITPINLAWAVGLACLFGLGRGIPRSSEDNDKLFSELLMPYISTTLLLIIGYISHIFM
ncbi:MULTISPECIES: hypothetical protein [Serratia]|uniref:hypothetical protein n=1 Tax=Serratia TaxID=613 RepID=UPI000F74A9D1|nr:MULTISPECIES: hypothetical protein [Serratia]EKT8564898.1 hypothetical protein [Citrobacter freundii]EKU0825225.1 hypothetical protein [Citrobacter freundii]EKU8468042.1 hypothetical protein [Citrobacter freundii]EKU8795718.1 hypothetical protein [Citrobacter freundii]EKU8796023.1 hypothetical protein [Citrobacter freundii]